MMGAVRGTHSFAKNANEWAPGEWHHSVNRFQDGGALSKKLNRGIAMERATPQERARYPLLKWNRLPNQENLLHPR
jgi:hypothetical protein